jgi:hypothetical protein
MFNLKFASAIGLVFAAILSLSLFLIVPSKANTVSTSWRVNFVPPLTRQNGEPLLPEEIKWIACNYKGMGSTDWTWGKNTTEQGQTYVDLVDLMLESGDYEIACQTLDINGLKSVYSVPIIMTVVPPSHFPPSAPTDVTAREL